MRALTQSKVPNSFLTEESLGNNEALAREGIDTIKDFECIEDKHLVTMRH